MEIHYNQFIGLLRSALHSLYDPDQLRRSPLVELFGVSNKATSPFTLQKILLDAIDKVKPAQDTPTQSQGWLLHDVLFFRYVRGYEREAVANQLGFSERQLSRETKAALEVLAHSLWEIYHLENGAIHSSTSPSTAAQEIDPFSSNNVPASTREAMGATGNATSGTPSVEAGTSPKGNQSEERWIEALPTEKSSPWKTTFQSVLDLLRPFASQNEVQLEYNPGDDLPDLMVPQNTVRHSLMNILGVIIPFARSQKLTITAGVSANLLMITATVYSTNPLVRSRMTEFPRHTNFEVARNLLERMKGTLRFAEAIDRFEVTASIPTLAQIPVLVIDDNPDTIQLFQRYAQGTRYAVTGASGAIEFAQLVDQIHPRIILIDLMMPEIDGWDLLYQLRQAQPAQDAAIIICSILPQENLARSLGADGFLQKPTLPQDFLRTLDQLTGNFSEET